MGLELVPTLGRILGKEALANLSRGKPWYA